MSTYYAVSRLNFADLPQAGTIDSVRRRAASSKSKKMDKVFFESLVRGFQAHHKLPTLELAETVFNYALWTHKIKWKRGDELKAPLLRKIAAAFEKTLAYHGKGACTRSYEEVDMARSFVEFMAMKRDSTNSLASKSLFKAVFVHKDEKLLADFRTQLQVALDEGLATYQRGETTEQIFTIFVYNILSLIPYSYPEEGTTFSVPTQRGGYWQKVEYTVDRKIPLTPSWFSSPLPIYGLTSAGGPPLLLCLGTTYPAGEGFMATLLADCTPGLSVGQAATWMGKSRVADWLEGKSDVKAIGLSLGGALAIYAARKHVGPITEVHAFEPAGNHFHTTVDSSIDVHIYSQWGDVVSHAGFFPEGDNISCYRIMGSKSENFAYAHQRVYAGDEQVTVLRTTPEYENSRWDRKALTVGHCIGSPIVFFILLPIHIATKIVHTTYKIFSLSYLDKKEKSWCDVALIVSMVCIGALLIGVGMGALLAPDRLYPAWALQLKMQFTQQQFVRIAIGILTLGSLLFTGALRASLRKPTSEEESKQTQGSAQSTSDAASHHPEPLPAK